MARPAASMTAPAYSAKRSTSRGWCSSASGDAGSVLETGESTIVLAVGGIGSGLPQPYGFLRFNHARACVNPPSGWPISLDSGLRARPRPGQTGTIREMATTEDKRELGGDDEAERERYEGAATRDGWSVTRT